MKIKAQVMAIEPVILRQGEGEQAKIAGEAANITMVATLPKEYFEELIAAQEAWGVELELKTTKRKR